MQTDNFQIYSQAGERETRDALQYFETVRSFFVTLTGNEPPNPVPVYIVLFNSDKEYAPYRPSEAAIAYYFGGAERDYIVMGKTGQQTAQAATHEYVHLVVRHLGIEWPAWMDEGHAELFSTLRLLGKDTEFGDIIPGRMVGLLQDRWVPLFSIFDVDHDSPFYNEKDKASSFYNESWALVQMLATHPDYMKGIDQVRSSIAQGMPSVEALERTYGKPVERIETELRAYVRSGNYRKLVLPVRIDSVKLKNPSKPADTFDVRLALADLLNQPDQLAERRTRLEDLAREFPDRPESFASLGYFAWRERDNAKAAEYFAKAFALGDRGSKLLWDLGRLGQGPLPEQALAALDELVKREPGNVEVGLELASFHARQQRWSQSLIAARGITKVTAAMAPRLFRVKAQAEMQLNMHQEARASAESLKKYAKEERDQEFAARVLEYLDQRAEIEKARLNAAAARAQPEPLREPEPVASSTPAAPKPAPGLIRRDENSEGRGQLLLDANGKFVELACEGDAISMVLETTQGRKSFRLMDPNDIVVTGAKEGFADLYCGPQENPLSLRIQFAPPTAEVKADGLLRAIHFPQK